MIMTILTTMTIYISGYINLLFVGPRTHIDGHQPCQWTSVDCRWFCICIDLWLRWKWSWTGLLTPPAWKRTRKLSRGDRWGIGGSFYLVDKINFWDAWWRHWWWGRRWSPLFLQTTSPHSLHRGERDAAWQNWQQVLKTITTIIIVAMISFNRIINSLPLKVENMIVLAEKTFTQSLQARFLWHCGQTWAWAGRPRWSPLNAHLLQARK